MSFSEQHLHIPEYTLSRQTVRLRRSNPNLFVRPSSFPTEAHQTEFKRSQVYPGLSTNSTTSLVPSAGPLTGPSTLLAPPLSNPSVKLHSAMPATDFEGSYSLLLALDANTETRRMQTFRYHSGSYSVAPEMKVMFYCDRGVPQGLTVRLCGSLAKVIGWDPVEETPVEVLDAEGGVLYACSIYHLLQELERLCLDPREQAWGLFRSGSNIISIPSPASLRCEKQEAVAVMNIMVFGYDRMKDDDMKSLLIPATAVVSLSALKKFVQDKIPLELSEGYALFITIMAEGRALSDELLREMIANKQQLVGEGILRMSAQLTVSPGE